MPGVGVAAADVLVASLEQRVVPALAALGRPAALTNVDGRVIASNDASVVPGQRVPVERSAHSPVRPWLIVDL